MIELYIGGMKAEIHQDADINFTYTFEKLSNPTAIQNPYTKTIQLKCTQANNAIFNHIYQTDHIILDFNPNQRINFALFWNKNIVESGYLKLNTVTLKNGLADTYDVTLYGELGNFFHTLAYDSDGNERTISSTDLQLDDNTRAQYSHIISAAEVIDSFKNEYRKYILAYKGKYNNFNSQMEYRDNDYHELTVEVDEHQRNEFRAARQLPAIRFKELFSYILNVMQNNGYTFNLDTSFFTSTNPYYNNTWVTMNNYLENKAYIEGNDLDGVEVTVPIASPQSSGYTTKAFLNSDNNRTIVNITPMEDSSNFEFWGTDPHGIFTTNSIRLNLQANTGVATIKVKFRAYPLVNLPGVTNGGSAAYGENSGEFTATYDASLSSPGGGSVQSTGFVTFHTSTACAYIPHQDEATTLALYSVINSSPYGNPLYADVEFTLTTTSSSVCQLILRMNITSHSQTWFYTYGDALRAEVNVSPNAYRFGVDKNEENSITVTFSDQEEIVTGNAIGWDNLVNNGITQYQVFINYLKSFGLQIEVDRITKVISILTRNKYFEGYTIEDWTDKIDYSKDFKITPRAFDTKFITLSWNSQESYYEKKYADTYNRQCGAIRIDTGYGFNTTTKELLENNPYNNVVISREKDFYFKGRYRDNENIAYDDKVLPAFFDLSDGKRDGINTSLTLFFENGTQNIQGTGLRITDDAPDMILNNTLCWIAQSETSYAKEPGEIPNFTRIYNRAGGNLPPIVSLDFGKPNESYDQETNDTTYPATATIYAIFWQKWIEERYSDNCKVLECHVHLKPQDVMNFRFNKFVKIRNTLWHINKITDWSLTKLKSTKVELIRVTDINAYINGQHI